MTTLPLVRPRTFTSPLAAVLTTDRSLVLFTLRIALGVVMLPHGMQKVFGSFGGGGISGTLGWFDSIGIPAVLGVLAIAAEFAGALGLIAGLGTRVAAFGIGVTMIVAAAMHRAHFFMNWSGAQGGEGFEYHILAVAMAFVLVLGGGGRWSVDRALTSGKQ